MAYRGREDTFVCRFADGGNNKVIPRPRAHGKSQLSAHRIAERGSGGVDPDPWDLKIKCLQQRIRDLEAPSTLEETEPEETVWDDLSGDEEHPTNIDAIYESPPVFDNYGDEDFIYELPPVFDEYGDEEWYIWVTGNSIVEDDLKRWNCDQSSIVYDVYGYEEKESFDASIYLNEVKPIFLMNKKIYGPLLPSIQLVNVDIFKSKVTDFNSRFELVPIDVYESQKEECLHQNREDVLITGQFVDDGWKLHRLNTRDDNHYHDHHSVNFPVTSRTRMFVLSSLSMAAMVKNKSRSKCRSIEGVLQNGFSPPTVGQIVETLDYGVDEDEIVDLNMAKFVDNLLYAGIQNGSQVLVLTGIYKTRGRVFFEDGERKRKVERPDNPMDPGQNDPGRLFERVKLNVNKSRLIVPYDPGGFYPVTKLEDEFFEERKYDAGASWVNRASRDAWEVHNIWKGFALSF